MRNQNFTRSCLSSIDGQSQLRTFEAGSRVELHNNTKSLRILRRTLTIHTQFLGFSPFAVGRFSVLSSLRR